MMKIARVLQLSCVALFAGFQMVSAQERPPATPLIAHNPYFSVWSATDKLTDSETTHWTGKPQPIGGLARIDGSTFRFMGAQPRNMPAMTQTIHSISATHTDYEFTQGGVSLHVSFFTPAFTNDLDLLSRPVTYISWRATSTDGASHQVSVLLDVDPLLAVNERGQQVVTTRHNTETLDVLSVGSRDQAILNRSGDDLRIDWGYFRLAIPKSEPHSSSIALHPVQTFAKDGKLPGSDAIEMPEPATPRASTHLAATLDFGAVGASPVDRHLLVAYTEGYAIQFMQRNLRPYWQRNGMSVGDMLENAEKEYTALEARGRQFDKDLTADMTAVGGEHYAALVNLSYRQTLAANGLAADLDGQPMHFPKENFSNGCISTVDVLYPSSPFFLFFSPKLLEAELRPVLEYSALPRWRFPFAPHDLGQYPLANGQVYGGGEVNEENQMPVEESGNMLIMVDALARAQSDTKLAQQYWPQLTKWADYLKEKGLDPENQLTTDDFAGHVAHNANLSIKAIDAIAAYADLAHLLHHEDVARSYSATAKDMAGKWITMSAEGDHYKLAFNSPGTWSQKYNLVWDRILGYNLFPDKVRETEYAYYLTKLNQYGLPLDVRKDYTKLDWSLWTATLTTKRDQFDAIMNPIYTWINETPTRVPLTDWYDTKTGKQQGFQARSVVGGVLIKALADKELTDKWHQRAK
ncbi:MAG TPA: DUF4965 domain-containing protein [Acidobacteriaceae bacterium]